MFTNTTEVLQNNTFSSGIIFVIPLLKIKFSQNHLKRNIKQFFSISFFKKNLLQFLILPFLISVTNHPFLFIIAMTNVTGCPVSTGECWRSEAGTVRDWRVCQEGARQQQVDGQQALEGC